MSKYITFDVVRYIRDQKSREERRLELLDAYNDINLVSGGLHTAYTGSGISHPTERRAMGRLKIREELDEIDRENRAFNRAWKKLEGEQKTILSEFLFSDDTKYHTATKIAERLKISVREVYNRRETALAVLSKYIIKELQKK